MARPLFLKKTALHSAQLTLFKQNAQQSSSSRFIAFERSSACGLISSAKTQLSSQVGALVLKNKNIQAKAYNTRYSQAVTHPSTNRARRCLTSQIGRDGVRSTWYGRRR